MLLQLLYQTVADEQKCKLHDTHTVFQNLHCDVDMCAGVYAKSLKDHKANEHLTLVSWQVAELIWVDVLSSSVVWTLLTLSC